MVIFSTYSVKIQSSLKKVFEDTAKQYRNAVDFFIRVRLQEDSLFRNVGTQKDQVNMMETLTVPNKRRPTVPYDFSAAFYKFPSYYRRAAISEALGKVDSYQSNYANWEKNGKKGKAPSVPQAGHSYPSLYHDQCYARVDPLTAAVKVFIRNTWDWVEVPLRKTDVDYITKHCANRKECCPTLQKRGKKWSLDFPFSEKVELDQTPVNEQIILAVDLGINNACTCCAMTADGTILGRKFLSLSREQDCLQHSINMIKQAQQRGARRMPRLWASAKGINDDIAVKTAQFIIDTAVLYSAFTIVFEHLELNGKKRGSKKQLLHHWRADYVQAMVADKGHRLHMHVVHVNAWGTSHLAFDGSGKVQRGKEAELGSYSLCKFQSGKVYNCDLNASYNIGARYFIREILKTLPAKVRSYAEAKVPQCTKRSTCTLSTLISLNAVLQTPVVSRF